MICYDILWTENEDIDEKILSLYLHIKLEIEIGFKKEVIKNKYNVPRSFWFIEKDKDKFNKILDQYPEIKEYFKEQKVE